MKRLLVILLVFAFVVPSVVASGPPPQGGTPSPQGGVPPIGQKEPGDTFSVDLANLPVLEELAGTGLPMNLSSEKRDKGRELVHSLTDEQRASVSQLLAGNPLPVPDNVFDPAQAKGSADELGRGIEKAEASLAEVKRWQDAISAGLAGILTPEQHKLYQDSLLPAPDRQMPDMQPKSQTDCYWAYYYGYYGRYYGYYFYLYAYYYTLYTSPPLDPYTNVTVDLAYRTYLFADYAWTYTYYSWYYYYSDPSWRYYTYYFTRHAEGFSYYGMNMANILYSWAPDNPYAQYAYVYSEYAYNSITAADNYAYVCYYETPVTGNKYAVVVGIADFQYGSDLNYTDDDARDFRDTLINRGGFTSGNINLMIDSQATKANIQSAITSWLDSREGANDLVVIFYSAHGSNGTDVSPIDEADGLDEYLVAYDSYSASTMIRDEEFDGWLDNLESTKVVVIIDTCYSGGMIGSSAAGDGWTARFYPMPGQEVQATSVLPGDGFARDVNQSGRIVMTASAETELSWETSALQNGVFTYYLTQGLASSSADTNSNNWVSAEEAYTYLNPLVQSYTGNQQHPQQSDNISGQVDLTQPASAASADQRQGYLPVGDSSGQDQPGDRGELSLAHNLDPFSVPEELAGTDLPTPLDTQKAQVGFELARSLTAEQKDRIRALLESNRSAALERAAADLAQAAPSGKEPGQDLETLEATLAEVSRWQGAISAGLAGILSPEQYGLYQDSLLPAPDVQMLGTQPKSQGDCYNAYVYLYSYGNPYAYYHYLYAYYTYLSHGDPYCYDNYLFGYYDYMSSYNAWVYSYYAYVYWYNSTYGYLAYYWTRHAQGFSYWGYNFASITHTWAQLEYSWYAYAYGYYAYYYINIADGYAWDCYTDIPVPTVPNGNFESGHTSWTEYSAQGWPLIMSSSDLPVAPHSGSWAAWLGGDHNEISSIYQYVTVPSGSPYLSYYYWINSDDYCGYDYGYVTINGSHVRTYNLCSSTETGGWANGNVNMSSYAGQTVLLQFTVTTDSSYLSSMLLDDIAWASTASAETTPATEVDEPAVPFQRPGVSEPSEPGDKPQPDASSPEAEYSLTADRDTVIAGECVTLKWHAQNVQEAYLDGEGLVGSDGEKVDCPCQNKDYVLHVVLADGTTRDVIRTVIVKGECGAPLPQVPDDTFVRPQH